MTMPVLSDVDESEPTPLDFCGTCRWSTTDHEELTAIPLPDAVNCSCGRDHPVRTLYVCDMCLIDARAGDRKRLTKRMQTPSGDRPSRRRLANWLVKQVESHDKVPA